MHNKRKNQLAPLVLLAPIGIAVILLLLIPAFLTFSISFQKEYNPAQGMSGAVWVGFQNYAKFYSDVFLHLLGNNFIISTLSIVIPAIPAFLIAWKMVKIPQNWRGYLTGALLLPVFIPTAVYTSMAVGILPSSFLTNSALFPFIYVMIKGIPAMFFTAFLGAAIGQECAKRGKSPLFGAGVGVAVSLFCQCARFLTLDNDVIRLFQNPNNLVRSDIFDTYVFRATMQSFSSGPSCAAWVTKILLQIPIAVLVAILLHMFLKTMGGGIVRRNRQSASPLALVFPAVGVVLAILIAVLVPPSRGEAAATAVTNAWAAQSTEILLTSLGNTLFVVFIASFLFLLFMLLAGYSCYQLGNGATFVLCVVILLFSQNDFGEYLFYRMAGMINSQFSIMLTSFLRADLLLPLVILTVLSLGDRKAGLTDWLKKALPTMILFLGLNATAIWGSSREQLLFISQQDRHGLGSLLRQNLLMGINDSAVYLTLSLSSLGIGILFIFIYGFLRSRQPD